MRAMMMKTDAQLRLRLVVQGGEEVDPRIFDLPLPVMSAVDQARAVTMAAHAFARAFNDEVRLARGLQHGRRKGNKQCQVQR